MEKYIHHPEKPKRPIGEKRRPKRATEYRPEPDAAAFLKRMGIREERM